MMHEKYGHSSNKIQTPKLDVVLQIYLFERRITLVMPEDVTFLCKLVYLTTQTHTTCIFNTLKISEYRLGRL